MSASSNPPPGPSEAIAEVVNVGDELLAGDVVNTNAVFLAQRCRELGLTVRRAQLVRDRIVEIAEVVRAVARTAEICFVSGGLGPTTDDLTTAAVAEAAGVPVHRDEAALERLREKFRQLGRPMPESNAKQADFPQGAVVLANPVGTAEGFSIQLGTCSVFVLPGPPRELRRMMVEQVEPILRRRFPRPAVARRIYRVVGLGESALAERLAPWLDTLPGRSPGYAAMFVHYRASMPEVQVVFEATPGPDGVRATAEELTALDAPMLERLGGALYGIGTMSLAERVVTVLAEAGLRLCVAESCTGGGVARRLVEVPGASAVFDGAIVAYDDRVKIERLGVAASMLAEHGAVSQPVAIAMAEGARAAIGSDLSVAITGIAGPSGGTPEKPVGTVHFAVSDAEHTRHQALHFRGDRGSVQKAAEHWALKLVWDRLVLRGLTGPREMHAPADQGSGSPRA